VTTKEPAVGWVIYDLEARHRYIPRVWPSKAAADAELSDLLQPYPAGDEWRRRLVVRRA
jgi:hypothetical protein